MEKTIILESSKELQDVMPEKTKYYICGDKDYWPYSQDDLDYFVKNCAPVDTSDEAKLRKWIYKTLTLTEAIDMLPRNFREFYLSIERNWEWWQVTYRSCEPCETLYRDIWKTLLEAVEKMLLHLHRQWLLTK